MASEEVRKKWGTIFMGDREASVEQLNAMQEPLRREKQQKEQAEDYMERVRLRAAERAREILGAAYTERQKVLEEAKTEAASLKKAARTECANLVAQGEAAKRQALSELQLAEEEREEATRIREAAHQEGIQTGLEEASAQLHEFRNELGSSLGVLMQTIEGQRKKILDSWRDDLCELTRCAVQAGVGMVLEQGEEKVLRSLLYKALDVLENRASVAVRVNPENEASVNDLFLAARERFPELHTWVVTADPSVTPGGLVAESGSGSADLRRENFQELVNGILEHLGLPERSEEEADAALVRALVEKEVAEIAALTPESDRVSVESPQGAVQPEDTSINDIPVPEEPLMPEEVLPSVPEPQDLPLEEPEQPPLDQAELSLAELEDELFPLEEKSPLTDSGSASGQEKSRAPEPASAPEPDQQALAEGGFV